ncbi:MAG: type I restriction-modification system subunit M, partial [Clostridia bacterium]
MIQRLTTAFKNIEDSTIASDGSNGFQGLFSDILLTSNTLGDSVENRCNTLLDILQSLDNDKLTFFDSSLDI